MGALFELMGYIVEFFLRFVLMLAQSLGFAVGHLAEKPEEAEARFSGQRLLTAFAPLAGLLILAAAVAGTFLYLDWRGEARRAEVRETRQLIEGNIQRLAANVDEDGHFIPPSKEVLDVDDPWDNPLRVDYEESLWQGLLSVRSDGPD
jgi:hypothetical protein